VAVCGGDISVAVQAQEADGEAAERCHDAGRVSRPDQRAVLLVSHVSHPVEAVFYLPVAADPGARGPRRCRAPGLPPGAGRGPATAAAIPSASSPAERVADPAPCAGRGSGRAGQGGTGWGQQLAKPQVIASNHDFAAVPAASPPAIILTTRVNFLPGDITTLTACLGTPRLILLAAEHLPRPLMDDALPLQFDQVGAGGIEGDGNYLGFLADVRPSWLHLLAGDIRTF
jgi:hypothetical protein